MKKLVITSTTGALLLFLLSASCGKINTPHKMEIPVLKCSESFKTNAQDCLEQAPATLHSELFLRPIKKKERRYVV